jgi:mannitol/fructose-specific phosphotransferase system IIA component (Ntr-type)
MKLRDIVVEKAIVPGLSGLKRDVVLAEMLDAMVTAVAAPAAHRDTLLKGIIARERRGSTGFGHGVAVPHVKTTEVPSIRVAVGISETGIDFGALDKQPVHSVFLLLSPESRPEEHIDAMEAIFANLSRDQFRRFLRQASTAEDILTLLEEADAAQAG